MTISFSLFRDSSRRSEHPRPGPEIPHERVVTESPRGGDAERVVERQLQRNSVDEPENHRRRMTSVHLAERARPDPRRDELGELRAAGLVERGVDAAQLAIV